MSYQNMDDMFDDEGPTTSNALRADSGVSDGNVSLNNDEETNDTKPGRTRRRF